MIYALYKQVLGQFKTRLSEIITITICVWQGCQSCPTLFELHINELEDEITFGSNKEIHRCTFIHIYSSLH